MKVTRRRSYARLTESWEPHRAKEEQKARKAEKKEVGIDLFFEQKMTGQIVKTLGYQDADIFGLAPRWEELSEDDFDVVKDSGIQLPNHSVLKNKLKDLPLGTLVEVRYLGTKEAKEKDKEYHVYAVDELEIAQSTPAPATEKVVAASEGIAIGEGDLPF